MFRAAPRLLLLVALCGASASQVFGDEADDRFNVAADQYAAKHWDQAAAGFRQFLADYPNSAKRGQAMLFAGESLVQLGRNADAYPILVDLLAEQPTSPLAKQALFRAVEAAAGCGKIDEAKIRIAQFQSKYPADKLNANLLMDQAKLALSGGDVAAAEKFYRQSLDRFSESPTADECRLGLVHVLQTEKQPEAAEQLLREVAQHDHSPFTEMAMLQLADAQLAANRPQAALEQYEAIEKRFPSSPLLAQTHLGCGRALFQMNRFADTKHLLSALADNTQVGVEARHWLVLAQKAEDKEQQRLAKEQEQQRIAAEKEQRRIADEEKRRKVAEELQRVEAQKEQDRLAREEERRVAIAKAEQLAAQPSAPQPSAVQPPPAATTQPAQSPIVQAAPAEAPNISGLRSVMSSRRDVKAVPAPVAAVPGITTLTINRSAHGIESESSTSAVASPDATAAAQPAVASPLAANPASDKVAPSIEDQNRRRSATIRYQAANAMIRAGDFGRAIATLQMGDNSGDDPQSLGNRYLLSTALEKAGRADESLQTLDQLSAALQAKLAAGASVAPQSSSESAETFTALSREDVAALRQLNDSVQLSRIDALMKREKFVEAIEPLQIYLAASHNGADARTRSAVEQARSTLALCLAKTNRVEEARQTLDGLRIEFPASRLLNSTTEQVARAAYDAGQFVPAAEMFATLATEGNPPETVATGLAGIGWCRYQAGEFEAANSAMAHFLQKFPTDSHAAEIALLRGQVLERLNRDTEAADVYRMALKRYPQAKQMPQLLLAAARLYDRLQQDEEAIPLYQRIVREYPKNPDTDAVLYDLSWSLRDLGRGNDSDRVFHKLCEEHPHSRFAADAAYRLAERASQQNDREAARTLLVPLLAKEDCPPDVREHALYLLAQMAVSEEKWTAAEPFFEQLIRDFPEGKMRLPSEFWLAEVAFRGGDYTLSQQRFETLAPRVSDHSEPWMAIVPLRRAQILAGQKQWTQALALAETVGQDYPQFDRLFEADYVMGRALMAEDKLDDARAAFLRVVKSTTGGKTETAAMAQTKIADTYFQQENYAAAVREYLKVDSVYSFPHWQAAALLQAAKCYSQLGQAKEAGELYARVLQNYPQTEFVAEASRKLMETTRK